MHVYTILLDYYYYACVDLEQKFCVCGVVCTGELMRLVEWLKSQVLQRGGSVHWTTGWLMDYYAAE